jgi:hypothetical protein
MTHRRSLALFLALGLSTALAARTLQDSAPTREQLLEQSRPGDVHELLAAYAGEWEVAMRFANAPAGQELTGAGTAETILDGRYLVVDFGFPDTPTAGAFRYTLGFDRRHDEHSIVVMDTSGTYFVTARGGEEDGRILMRGTDDDPLMASMGFEKKFAFELELEDADRFTIRLHFVDTRVPEEPLMPYARYSFTRAG